jgi:hypothetical protein
VDLVVGVLDQWEQQLLVVEMQILAAVEEEMEAPPRQEVLLVPVVPVS